MPPALGSKLLKLKDWLTLPAAAKHISGICGEEVTEADILRFALDGHLKLSVNFVNLTNARCGRLIKWNDPAPPRTTANWLNKMPNIPNEILEWKTLGLPPLRINDTETVYLDEEVITLSGIWDLPMIGSEWWDIEHKWHELTGGPPIDPWNEAGVFVEGPDNIIYQLQTLFSENDYQIFSDRQLALLKGLIDGNNLSREKGNELISRHIREWEKYLSQPHEDYLMAAQLPHNSILVIRTDNLRKFEQLICDSEAEAQPKAFCNIPSKNLSLLITASERFWQNADPEEQDTHPINKDIEDWLKDKGLSERLAGAGASIIRPEWARNGRKPNTL